MSKSESIRKNRLMSSYVFQTADWLLSNISRRFVRCLQAIAIVLSINGPAFGIDLSLIEATVKECNTGPVCPCPRAKIKRVDKSVCGANLEIKLDQYGNYLNRREQETQNKCISDVLDANIAIDRYNSIFDACQNPYSRNENVKGALINKPTRPYSSNESTKTLAEQVTEAREDERSRQAAELLRDQQAEQGRRRTEQQGPQPQVTPDGPRSYSGREHRQIVECARGSVYRGRDVLCLAQENFIGGCTQDTVNDHDVFVCPGGSNAHFYYELKSQFTSGQAW